MVRLRPSRYSSRARSPGCAAIVVIHFVPVSVSSCGGGDGGVWCGVMWCGVVWCGVNTSDLRKRNLHTTFCQVVVGNSNINGGYTGPAKTWFAQCVSFLPDVRSGTILMHISRHTDI